MADKELTRKIDKAVVVVTTPDVCKAPVTPTPFVSYSKFDLSIHTADKVRMTSCVSFTKVSRLSMTMADEGGVGGGLKSQVMGGMCRPFSGWSSTVRAQGNEICRHDVVMEVNCAGSEGPGNTFGKVIYIESLSCCSITEQGEIVIDEEDSQGSEESQHSSAPDSESPSSEGASPEQEPGFTDEAGKRIGDEVDGILQMGEDAIDVVTDPEARQAAIDAVKETAGAAYEDPVGFGMEAGGQIVDDIVEPFDTALDYASKGAIGAGIAAAGYGILNIFNPAKKVKILQTIGKLGKGKKRKGKNKKDKKQEDSGGGDQGDGSDGGTVKKPKAIGSGHAKERHGPNRKAKYKNKSHFDSDADVDKVISESNDFPSKTAPNGNNVTVFESSVSGTDMSTGAGVNTNTMTVVTKPDGTVITAHPGTPYDWGTGAYK